MRIDDYRPKLADFTTSVPGGVLAGRYQRVFTADGQSVFENRLTLPRAHAVTELLAAGDISEVRRDFFLRTFDPGRTALLDPADYAALRAQPLSDGNISLEDETADRIRLTTDFPGPGFVVLADQYDPVWQARVDGVRTAIYRADGVLRGVSVSAGRHQLLLTYMPTRLRPTLVISLLTLILCLAVLLKPQVQA